mgnify:CR=1 FL=1
MSDETDLINTLALYVELGEDGGLNVSGAQYLDQDLEPEMTQYMTCLMRGMFVLFDDLTDTFVHVGSLMEAYSEMVEKAEFTCCKDSLRSPAGRLFRRSGKPVSTSRPFLTPL